MRIALTIFPTFSNKSIPLGLACINGALREAGYETEVYDFDFGLSVENPQLYGTIHEYAWQGDPHVVNFLGGTDVELVLGSVFQELRGAYADPSTKEGRHVEDVTGFVEASVERILDGEPDQVWFSTYVSTLWLSMLAAQAIRRASPKTGIVFGGPAVFTEEIRKFLLLNGIVDGCFVGEGERTAVDFLKQCEARGGAIVPVPGAAVMSEGSYSYVPRPLVKKLADLPAPDFEGFPFPDQGIRTYLRRSFHGLPVFFSRGCVQKCAFCAERNIWTRFRTKTPEAIVTELQYYRDRYGISLFYSCDSLVNFTVAWLEELCDRIIEAELHCSFSFAFAIGKRLPRHLAHKMVEAGFTRLFIGAEHGSQPMLDRMNKGTEAEEVLQVTCDAIEAGLSVQLGTIVNFPGETTQDVLDEIALFKKMDDTLMARGVPEPRLPRRSLANRFRLDPGTAMLQDPGAYGVTLSAIENPLRDDRPGLEDVLVRWDFAEPQDAEFHRYLVAPFGNRPERWAVPGHLSLRMAAGLQDFLSDDDTFRLERLAVIVEGEDGGGVVHTSGKSLPLTPMMKAILEALATGDSLRLVHSNLSRRYDVSEVMLRKTAALFFLEWALEFVHVAPRHTEHPELISPRRTKRRLPVVATTG